MFKKYVQKVDLVTIVGYEKLRSFIEDRRGVTAIEYALIAVAISTLLFLVLGNSDEGGLTQKIKEAFKTIEDGLTVTKDKK